MALDAAPTRAVNSVVGCTGNGVLSQDEFCERMLPELGLVDLDREAMDELFRLFDRDGSGDISFAEVNRIVRGAKPHLVRQAASSTAKRPSQHRARSRTPSPPPVPPVELGPLRHELLAELTVEADKWAKRAEMDQELYGDIFLEDAIAAADVDGDGELDADELEAAKAAITDPSGLRAGTPQRRGKHKKMTAKEVSKSDAPLSALRRLMVESHEK